jgi:hypothetical protein
MSGLFDDLVVETVSGDRFGGRSTRNICQAHTPDKCFPNSKGYCACPLEDAPEATAELVCSDIKGSPFGSHMPVIDLDLPCRLVESGTPGHYHLYIDKAVTFERYKAILESMALAGIVQYGFYDATVERGFGSVRHPDRPKRA